MSLFWLFCRKDELKMTEAGWKFADGDSEDVICQNKIVIFAFFNRNNVFILVFLQIR